MTMRKSHRKHPDPNQEYVFDDSGREIAVIRDGATMHVSLLDAMAARGEHMTDADRAVLADAEYRKKTAGNRPGFRVLNDMEGQDGRTVMDAEYAAYEHRLVNSYRHVRDDVAEAEARKRLGGPNTKFRGEAGTNQRGARPGDPCSLNGYSGFLEYNDDGELVCRISAQPDAEEATSDRAMKDAEANRERAYAEYSARLQDFLENVAMI